MKNLENITWDGKCRNDLVHDEGVLRFKVGSTQYEINTTFEKGKINGIVDSKIPNKDMTFKTKFSCILGNCKGLEKGESTSGIRFEIDWNENRTKGYGTADFGNGTFVGEFRDGEIFPNGKGVNLFKTGEKYEGDFVNGFMEGKGTLYGVEYTTKGNFLKGKPEGFVTTTFKDGSIYEGNVLNWKFDGQEKFTEKDGSIYQGTFKDNEYSGQGRYKSSLYEYVGDFLKNMPNGNGTMIMYKNDKPFLKCEGNFVDGLPHGIVTLTPLIEGEVKKVIGNFNKYPVGNGKIYYKGGALYDGQLNLLEKSGRGVLIQSNGTKFEGNFRDDVIDGFTIQYYANGNKWQEVTYFNGLKEGTHKWYLGDITTGQLTYKKDVLISGFIVYEGRKERKKYFQ